MYSQTSLIRTHWFLVKIVRVSGTKGTWFAGGERKHGRVKLVLRCYEPVWGVVSRYIAGTWSPSADRRPTIGHGSNM